MIVGHCNCGSVSYEIDADIRDVYVCHCSICRRWTGNNGLAVVIAPKTAFRWVKGQGLVTSWHKPDAEWESSFCSRCGSALPGENDEKNMFVPAGLLDDPDNKLRVAAHIWVGSKATWDQIGGDAHQYERAYGDRTDTREEP